MHVPPLLHAMVPIWQTLGDWMNRPRFLGILFPPPRAGEATNEIVAQKEEEVARIRAKAARLGPGLAAIVQQAQVTF